MNHSSHERRFAFLPVIPERNHIMLVAALSFLLGTLSIFHLTVGPWLWVVFALGVLLGMMFKKTGLALLLCFFSLGALYANASFDTPAPEPGTYRITGTVHGGVTLRSDNRISFALTDICLDGEKTTGKAYCTLRYGDVPPNLFDGASVAFSGRAYLPDGKSGEPRFDFRLWTRQQGYRFCIAAYQGMEIFHTPISAPVSDVAYRVREACRYALERIMGEESRVAMALLFGQRSGLSDDEYTDFQHLGIAHIMCVSGLHVALLGGLVLRLLNRLRVQNRTQLGVLLLFLSAYCAVTGFSAAANRAAVMLLLSALARLWKRRPDRVILLSTAMLAVLLINPLHAHSAGFVLSFSAMAGITLYFRMLELWLDRCWPSVAEGRPKTSALRFAARMQRALKGNFVLSVTGQLGVLLPTAYYFHQLPLYGVFINMLIVPLVSGLLVPLYALCLPLSPVPVLGRALGGCASLLTKLLLSLVELLSTLPHAAVRVASPPLVLTLGLAFALIMLSRRVPASFSRRLTAAVLAICVACFAAWTQRPADVRYIQLSVGQADSALLMDGDQTILIDTGVDGTAAVDYLLHENRDIDALILTHLHIDHAGGVENILQSGIAVRQVYLPVLADEQLIDPALLDILNMFKSQNIPISALASGDKLRYNNVGIRVLWPERETVRARQDANDYPLVLAVDLDGCTLLQTSDLTGTYEAYAAHPADVLKVAHHGSYSSTGEAFLDFVSPSAAIISASSGPNADVLNRLAARGVETFVTGPCGDITVSVHDGALIVKPYKERTLP